jgi:hypothetical protein
MKDKTGEKLIPWCKNIIDDKTKNIKGFVKGVLNDYKAVHQGLNLIGVMGQSRDR